MIIVTPIDSHVGRSLSKSIMLSAPRYRTRDRSCSVAILVNFEIGDSICLPVANQNSSSHTQKSSSVCDAMACLSVMIMSSIISYFLPIESRCSDIGLVGVVFEVSPNVMSVNVGVDISAKSDIDKFESDSVGVMSKSDGNGISSSSGSVGVISGCEISGVCGAVGMLNAER